MVSMLVLMIHTRAYASKWIPMSPQEVIEESVLTVIGTYDFSCKPNTSEFVFEGYPFEVTKVFKGDSPESTLAAIDIHNTGGAKEFQAEGGKFLLFLERRKDVDFLVPIRGLNGMIQVVDEKTEDAYDDIFFDSILKAPFKEPIPGSVKSTSQDNSMLIFLSTSFMADVFIFFLIYWDLRNRPAKVRLAQAFILL
ncbi:hypothetical protein CUU66_16300 [Peribacillus deserti]|uniref:Uncharacterized protein n=2 Tax=Peribacillus deserti TaxID=673318 RepID=A0A2N5M3H2_9BACI|nr:hypothetical protein CUU66_16300 [Peribacillus deserti]